ncbi:MAG TPA: large conductance mechanosensitive channel protein MscL [Bdellovibrionota bacterium]|jgi:large conductance mechanosensitive channel|nr:large conductance mechanosensitive channel protein MscL [Bdellovibrionota bacterium]
MKGFKQFLLRGNVVDLAVAVVIGAAFGSLISSFVRDLLTPLVAAIFGKPDFSNLYFTLNNSRFSYGSFLNALIAFVLIGAAVYYFVVVPVNAVMARSRREAPAGPDVKKCPECLSEIPAQARRCAFCATSLAPVNLRQAGM